MPIWKLFSKKLLSGALTAALVQFGGVYKLGAEAVEAANLLHRMEGRESSLSLEKCNARRTSSKSVLRQRDPALESKDFCHN